jgi:endonuclease YncB( thermonuclease family)
MLRICSRFVWALVCVGITGFPALAETLRVTGPAQVIDGDTLQVGGRRIRLHGIDAPERDQPCETAQGKPFLCGKWVAEQVQARFGGRKLRCDVLAQDRYGRDVAKCFDGGEDIGRVLVQDGLAYAYRRYALDYDLDEKAAFVAGRGIHGFTLQSPAAHRAGARKVTPQAQDSGGDCRIKGNISAKGVRIFHEPGQEHYAQTRINTGKGERWFCSPGEARAAGWRAARR